ncbi:MAG: ATP synthase F1 subunit gamma [Calditrichaeota bacterium]|nr:ATP synthase F1 subunit gamma [Calditrichota bacterium]MCB9391603.1 ATP synthase F1 subunit gamma [Calditrichota bacterium]
MAGLKLIKRRIASVKATQQVTRVMKMVAAARLRRAQESMMNARPYSLTLRDAIRDLAAHVDASSHPLLEVRDVDHVGIIVVTGDRGLAGSFNVNVLKRAQQLMNENAQHQIHLVTVGKKGSEFFARRGADISHRMQGFFNSLNFSHAIELGEAVTAQYINSTMDRVYVVYNEFKSVIQQRVVVEQLLPIEPDSSVHNAGAEIIFEPSEIEVLKAILPKHVNVQLWRVLLESFASEMAARMTAMENATKNAGELIDSLTLNYNKARQSAITGEILEIVAGAEGLK